MAKKLKHVNRQLTDEERARHAQIRKAAKKDIPPKPGTGRKPSPPGIPSQIRQAREAQGLTWYALAKRAGIPNQATIRDIEQGKDVHLSNLQAVAGGVTIVEAQRALEQPVGYTTVQTRLNRMVKKGIVSRSRKRPAKYEAAVAPEDVSAEDLNLLVEKVSGGCVVPLVAHLVKDHSLTASEIDELKRLIAQAERRMRKKKRE